MIKVGDKVNHNAVTGDIIQVKNHEGIEHTLKVGDTWPNGIRAEALDGDWDTYLTYDKLVERGATFVRVREKVKLPKLSIW